MRGTVSSSFGALVRRFFCDERFLFMAHRTHCDAVLSFSGVSISKESGRNDAELDARRRSRCPMRFIYRF